MKKTFNIQGSGKISSIHVGERIENLEKYIPPSRAVIITDENIKKYYRSMLPDLPVITIGTGEKIKTLATVEGILKEMIGLSMDRSGFVIGIGGGIVCDIAGFAASVFMRGINFGFVSTSLLSQVDASVGGKNGVNIDSFKNMAGVFNQPEFVICDIDMLATLPEEEISNGLAEIVKHALICDAQMFEYVENNTEKALSLDRQTVFRLVADSVKIKSAVVQADEKESGERRKLNFGHTIGHAIEKIDQTSHGRAVATGMAAAALFSRHKNYITAQDVGRITDLLQRLQLTANFNYRSRQISAAAKKDKKKYDSDLFYVFLEKIGKAAVEKISMEQMDQLVASVFK